MEDIFVARFMSTDVYTVSPETLVEDAAGAMLERSIGSVVVVDDSNDLRGILTSTDFVQIVAECKPKDQTPVSAYMTEDVTTATAQDTVHDIAALLTENGFHHVPIVDETEGVIGMVSTSDLAAYLTEYEQPTAV
ncbi:CBS domain-containing protein [Halovivax gelatinilyticus]|uniref:CBS domain-containing protein n=1 Tax=Halovivax gelatinilyticus TaxID=2961597 RepID=UPI0020CA563E|nr:CBS domain-containing protein [Halovivax gelatinilyticus]